MGQSSFRNTRLVLHLENIFTKILTYFFFLLFILGYSLPFNAQTVEAGAQFDKIVVDANGPISPWGKSIGDINNDGKPDLIVGGHSRREPSFLDKLLNKLNLIENPWTKAGELFWYENPGWQKHLISDEEHFRTDHEVIDINNDGKNDVVSVTDSGLMWFRNPDWKKFRLDTNKLHDVEVADFDGDGDQDIVARNQSLFGYDNGNILYFYRQDTPEQWYQFKVPIHHGEGLAVADLNSDSLPDVIVNQKWYINPGTLDVMSKWQENTYCPSWKWLDAFIDIADINGDGHPDIVLSPAEPADSYYRISWCEAPTDDSSQWNEHIVDSRVEAVRHSIRAGDFNDDGRMDIVSAEMTQGEDPDEVNVYWQSKSGRWQKEIVSTLGSHSMRVADIDGDGIADFFGANWHAPHEDIELWLSKKKNEKWRRYVIDGKMPWRSVFVFTVDVDNDSLKDIVAGAWWYKNPGKNTAGWKRYSLGRDANNVALVEDFDGDGLVDILASHWNNPRRWTLYERLLRKFRFRTYTQPGKFVWLRNEGNGSFSKYDNIPDGDGDFLQGAAILSLNERKIIALSWHQQGQGIEMLTVPDKPIQNYWGRKRLHGFSLNEELTAIDIDSDNDEDLVLGTAWLKNEINSEWSLQHITTPAGKPDRNKVTDVNGDGKLDIVVGFEAISTPGKLAWYTRTKDRPDEWEENVIAEIIGPMSLDVSDLDHDGDIDVIVGEHNLLAPDQARLLWYENRNGDGLQWHEHTIYVGDEHHDGAHVSDIDNDGDYDIVSIGWGHNRLILYENLTF